jgi:hypothetical protein
MHAPRATLDPMDPGQLDRILAGVCDIILEQGGDWDATEAVIRREFTGEELSMALDTYAATLLWVYAEPGGPALLRGMRDRLRRLVPVDPAPRRWPFRAVG